MTPRQSSYYGNPKSVKNLKQFVELQYKLEGGHSWSNSKPSMTREESRKAEKARKQEFAKSLALRHPELVTGIMVDEYDLWDFVAANKLTVLGKAPKHQVKLSEAQEKLDQKALDESYEQDTE
jgi:hypothetical protein